MEKSPAELMAESLVQLSEILAPFTEAMQGYKKTLEAAQFSPTVVDVILSEYAKFLFAIITRGINPPGTVVEM